MDDSKAQPAKADETKNDIEDGKPYLLKCLLNMGFTPQVADTICQSIPDELVDLQFHAYWAERYLDEKADETMNDIEAGKPSVKMSPELWVYSTGCRYDLPKHPGRTRGLAIARLLGPKILP